MNNTRVNFHTYLQGKQDEYIHVPEVTSELLRAKYKDLQKGVDTLGYIKQALEIERKKRELKERINTTYDYKKKPIVDADYQVAHFLTSSKKVKPRVTS